MAVIARVPLDESLPDRHAAQRLPLARGRLAKHLIPLPRTWSPPSSAWTASSRWCLPARRLRTWRCVDPGQPRREHDHPGDAKEAHVRSNLAANAAGPLSPELVQD